MTDHYDVIVVGLGGMGSAAAAQLAGRGLRTLGLEQFTPAHDKGSSHGDTRVIRQAYFEDPAYVPLLLRSYELYADLDRDDPGLFVETGGLMIGTASSGPVAGSRASADTWGLPYEMLDSGDIRRRFPTFTPSKNTVAFFEDRGGFVRPERTVTAQLRRAAARGAELHFQERVTRWAATDADVTITTDRGSYTADKLVITAGSWAPDLLADLALPLTVERQLLFWFHPIDGIEPFALGRQPIFIWETDGGMQLYGFPALDGARGGVKFAFYRNGSAADPDHLDREIHPAEIDLMRQHLAEMLPAANGNFLRGKACMYTVTPDLNFVIGTHPQHHNVVVGAGFSGHGFKFVPVVGEIISDLITQGSTHHPISLFDAKRWT